MRWFVDESGVFVELLASYPSYQGKNEYYICKKRNQEIFVIQKEDFEKSFAIYESPLTTQEKLELFFSVFKGRFDVYARSYLNGEGKLQYSPSYKYGWKDLAPEKREFHPLTVDVLKSHLKGETAIGIFPMLKDETCWFLVLDFDKKDWKLSVEVLRNVSCERGVIPAVEISRSGNGAHVWYFFENAILARDARNFGRKLLELSMLESESISFEAYDRMFPNQDILPKGGIGNLIALPLQGKAYENGNTLFVDEEFKPYANQWRFLQSIERIETKTVDFIVGIDSESPNLEQSTSLKFSNVLMLEKHVLSSQTMFYLKKMASFSNPEFYLKQIMRQPTYQIPERICLFEETDRYLILPRGLLQKLTNLFNQISIEDNRIVHSPVSVKFVGELRFEQEVALADVTSRDNGILQAETGFGKTVLGAALIAKHQARTIILVHNRQLLEQWIQKLSHFLEFEEEMPVRYTPKGREKEIGYIGQYTGSKKWRSKLVDVVMIQSMFNLDSLSDLLNEYTMMIIDECHHVTALMFEKVVKEFKGKYMYGLTATPERKNGHHPIIFQRIGDILHKTDAPKHQFYKKFFICLTSFGRFDSEKASSRRFDSLNDWLARDESRNQLIVGDVLDQIRQQRNCLVIVNRIEHIEILSELLLSKGFDCIFTLSGNTKTSIRKRVLEEIDKEKRGFILISTGKFIGEGFDLPQLDTLFLVGPLSWKNNLIQYAGRLHRSHEEKREVRIFDYLDIHVPYLERMFQRRQVAYKQMGYEIIEKEKNQKNYYRTADYEVDLDKDLLNAKKIHLILPFIQKRKLIQFVERYNSIQKILLLPEKFKNTSWFEKTTENNLTVLFDSSKSLTPMLIIDDYLIWYGALPLFTKVEDFSVLRLDSPDLVKEILEMNY
ncbi:TOTE conflict system archaeo-eukaryotic primase domain-containing protein [Streptococcus sp. 10F2]